MTENQYYRLTLVSWMVKGLGRGDVDGLSDTLDGHTRQGSSNGTNGSWGYLNDQSIQALLLAAAARLQPR